MQDFLDFKTQWEKEMEEMSCKSTMISSPEKTLHKPSKPELKSPKQSQVVQQQSSKSLSKSAIQSKREGKANTNSKPSNDYEAPPPGPVSYNLNYNLVEKKPSGYSFPKVNPRELKKQTDDRLILYPKLDAVKSNYHKNQTVMKKPQTKPLIKEDPPISLKLERAQSPDNNTIKKNTGISIAPLKYSKLSDLELERVIRYELRKYPYLVVRKKVECNPKYNVIEKNVHGVKIVSKRTESILKAEKEWEEMRRPNVFTYHNDDSVLKPRLPEFTFAKTVRDRTPSPDRRRSLNVDISAVKKKTKSTKIMPQHKLTGSEIQKEFEQMRMGPALYDPSHRLAEKRNDIGIVKIKQPYFTIKEEEEEDDRPNLFPNYDHDKPNKGTFKYYEPSKDLQPKHTPEKDLFPERWRFYDFDLDAVREEIAKEITFARNLTAEQYKNKEEFHEILAEQLRRQEKRPEVGQYNPQQPETKIEIDFSKAQGRQPFFDKDLLDDRDIDGDVLILEPQKPGKRLPDIKFDKYTGREEEKVMNEDINNQEQLQIEPNIDFVRKRQVFFADFNKQTGREEKKHVDDDEVYIKNFDYDEFKDPSVPKVKGLDFGKQPERWKSDWRKELGIEQDELVIENKLPEKPAKSVMKMDKGAERFPQKFNRDPFNDEQPISDFTLDVDKALKATKPGVSVANFKRYEKVKENQDLKKVKEQEQEKGVKNREKKKETNDKYKVNKFFHSKVGVNKAKKKGGTTQTKKKSEFDADAEINQYMKELGLE